MQLLLYSVLSYWRYLSCHSSIIRKMLSLNYLEISHGVNRSFRFFCSLNCDIFIIYLLKICSFLRKKKKSSFLFLCFSRNVFRLLCMLTFWCSFTPHISLTSFFWLFITEHLLCIIMLSLFNFASFQLFHPVGEIFDYRHIEGKVENAHFIPTTISGWVFFVNNTV